MRRFLNRFGKDDFGSIVQDVLVEWQEEEKETPAEEEGAEPIKTIEKIIEKEDESYGKLKLCVTKILDYKSSLRAKWFQAIKDKIEQEKREEEEKAHREAQAEAEAEAQKQEAEAPKEEEAKD